MEDNIESMVRRLDRSLTFEGLLSKDGCNNIVVKVKKNDDYFALKINTKWFSFKKEFKVQKALAGITGVPKAERFYGPLVSYFVDSYSYREAFLMELIDGKTLRATENVNDDFFDKLRAVARTINEQGYPIPEDRHLENVMADCAGNPWIVDFANVSYRGLSEIKNLYDESDSYIEGLKQSYTEKQRLNGKQF